MKIIQDFFQDLQYVVKGWKTDTEKKKGGTPAPGKAADA